MFPPSVSLRPVPGAAATAITDDKRSDSDSSDAAPSPPRRVKVNLDGSLHGLPTGASEGTVDAGGSSPGARPKSSESRTIRGAPVFTGAFVEVDEALDNPGHEPSLVKSMKYSASVLNLLGSSSPSPLASKAHTLHRVGSVHHNKGRLDGSTTPGACAAKARADWGDGRPCCRGVLLQGVSPGRRGTPRV